MKKTILFYLYISFSFSYGNAQISIHTEQLERFQELMKYLAGKNGGKLICKHTDNETELQAAFDKNADDIKQKALIDSLLSVDVYVPEIIGNVRAKFKEAKGKEAYRAAFTILPDYCIDMSAGMPELWIDYWNSEERRRVDSVIVELKAKKDEIIKNVKVACKALLPANVDMNMNIEIYIFVDGYRGGFQVGNKITMDAPEILLPAFIDILKHEMYHAYYKKWFDSKFSNKKRNESEVFLYQYQKSFIFEGIAQRLDYVDYGYEHEQMYANKELITELFDEWIALFRDLKEDSLKSVISMYQENEYEKSIERGKRYYIGKKDVRPLARYLLSYHIYNSIFERAGQKKLMYVIENPDKLLSVYNKLHSDSMFVPRIPDDVVTQWQENF